MIDWNAEQSDKFIGTAAAIATAIAAGVGTAGSAYAAHTASEGAKDAAKLQTDAAKYGADKQDEATQRAEAFQRQQAEAQWQATEQAQHSTYDQWAARQRAIAGLGSSVGLNIDIPDYVPGKDPGYQTNGIALPPSGPAGSGPSTSSSGGGDASKLKALLDGGLDPQSAVKQFNTQYGRSTGNEAVYYDPSQHGGIATIGLPDAYLAKPGASWDITQRSGGGGAAPKAPSTLGAYVSPSFAPVAPNTPIPTPYRPDTLAAYVRRS